jgi:Flp pilus assembly protein CpaB
MLHRSPRALLLWGAAAIVAIGTGTVVASDLGALHRHADGLGPELGAVVARHDLPVGATVTPDDLRVRPVHRSQLPNGVITSTETALGRVVDSPVLRGGFVTGRNLAARGRTGTDGALPAGTRAFHLVVADAVRPRAGAAVDVLATDRGATADPGVDTGASGSGTAQVVAAGVLVLATDENGRSAGGGPALGVTLLVSPRQARDLAAAAAGATVTIALVPPEDAHVPAP